MIYDKDEFLTKHNKGKKSFDDFTTRLLIRLCFYILNNR